MAAILTLQAEVLEAGEGGAVDDQAETSPPPKARPVPEPTGEGYQVPSHYRKCLSCHLVLRQEDLVDGACPVCQSSEGLKPMCPLDHFRCRHGRVEGIAYCPVCGEAVCPDCGSHDVVQVSRITGYYQDVSGWNEAKRQELKDRTRYTIGGQVVPYQGGEER